MGGETLEDMVKLIMPGERRDKMISYYELLGMIKENNIPEKVKYGGNTYIWNGRNYHCDENDYYGYLSGDIDGIDMIEKNIEIIKPKKIGKLGDGDDFSLATQLDIIDKINEIIEVINEEKEIQSNKE